MHPNKSFIFKRYTPYRPVPGEHLTVESRPFDVESDPPVGGITVENMYLSLDPFQRGQIRLPTDQGTYSARWIEGNPAVVKAISTVLKSDHPRFKPGDLVSGFADAAEYVAIPAEVAAIFQVLPALPQGIDISMPTITNALGVPGLAAYVSFFEFVPEPRAGKTIFVSAASGGVGQIVGQLAKMHGMKVIGSTGSPEKVSFVVDELGFDAAWNYKTENTGSALSRLAPEGLDVYYDNVGGEQLETALTRMKDFGNIVSSGMVSQYNYPEEEKYGIRTLMNVFLKRLTINGFICSDEHNLAKYMSSFTTDMVTWIAQGKIKTREEVVVGMENAPCAWVKMLDGDKFGKLVLKVHQT
ncbi:hypothetical protein SLS62_009234 [Diatrype stigma]|uniref:Dehydrogenase FUB6 n=1 Tax=Diatrype stigma TaxID=117547 RepID=A0AAN9YJ90_9PEZI